MFCAPGLDGDACTSDGQCESGVCSAGECFTPPTVGGGFDISRPGGGMIIVGPGGLAPGLCFTNFDCDENAGEVCDDGQCFLPTIVGPGGLNPLGPGGLPPIVGPGGLAPGLCQTDSDCDENAGEVCDAGECFLPDLVGGGFDISRPDGGMIIVGPGGLAPGLCFTNFDCDENAGEVCDDGQCILPTIVGPEGVFNFCFDDIDCDEDNGEVCSAGECITPDTVGPAGILFNCIYNSDCDENAGEVCDAGECFKPDTVGPGGVFNFCLDDTDCDEDAGEVCDAFECFRPQLVGIF